MVDPGWYLAWCAGYLSNFKFSFDYTPNPLRHTWSLCVEEHFYMIWPLFIYYASLQWLRPSAMGVALSGMVLAVIAAIFARQYQMESLNLLLYRGTPFRAASLAIGGLFCAVRTGTSGSGTFRPWKMAPFFFVPAVVCLSVGVKLGQPWLDSMKMIGFRPDFPALSSWRRWEPKLHLIRASVGLPLSRFVFAFHRPNQLRQSTSTTIRCSTPWV